MDGSIGLLLSAANAQKIQLRISLEDLLKCPFKPVSAGFGFKVITNTQTSGNNVNLNVYRPGSVDLTVCGAGNEDLTVCGRGM